MARLSVDVKQGLLKTFTGWNFGQNPISTPVGVPASTPGDRHLGLQRRGGQEGLSGVGLLEGLASFRQQHGMSPRSFGSLPDGRAGSTAGCRGAWDRGGRSGPDLVEVVLAGGVRVSHGSARLEGGPRARSPYAPGLNLARDAVGREGIIQAAGEGVGGVGQIRCPPGAVPSYKVV